MKVLVTGGAGYIGSILTPALLSAGYKVTVIDNFMFNQSSLLDCCNNPELTIIRGDARDESLISRELKDADVIIPLACLTGAPLCNKDPIAAQTTNVEAISLLNKMRSRDQVMIFPTTNSGYGVGQENLFCTEKTPLNPISLYGRLKVEVEDLLLNSGNCITLRLATVFGISPRMRIDLLVNDFTYRAVTDRFLVLFEANFKRNYIHVRDVSQAFLHCLDKFEAMKNEPYNVGLSEANLSKMELCMEIKKVVHDIVIIESEIGKDPDKRNYIVSNEKIEATGFRPKVSLVMGIQELVKGYQIVRRNTYANV